jgi:hypothetical protein
MQDDRVFLQFNIGFRILKVEAGVNLFQGLLNGVGDLLQVDLADNVETVIGHRISILSEMMESYPEGIRRRFLEGRLSGGNFAFRDFSEFEKIVEILGSAVPHLFRS